MNGTQSTFTESDVEQAVKFANIIFAKAKWEGLSTKETFEIRDSLAWYQQQLLPKMKNNILEIKGVHEVPPEVAVAEIEAPVPEKKTKAKAKSKGKK